MTRPNIDLIIVGGGPAGLSTALHLLQLDPAWASRMILLEKSRYPRDKLCGGGITRPGRRILSHLGLSLEIPHVSVQEVHLCYRSYHYRLLSEPVFVVVRRHEFDAWLARVVQAQGVTILEGDPVTQVEVREEEVLVTTTRSQFRARALVAADGSNSTVRRRLAWGKGHKARLLEILTPHTPRDSLFEPPIAVFDWNVLDLGIQGYYWDFPTLIDEKPAVNRGVFDSRLLAYPARASLPQALGAMLSRRGLDLGDFALQGHPIHWLEPTMPLARPRVLLAGDAAGVDPLFGEGISFALGYGQVAAETLQRAFRMKDFRFADYSQRVRQHPLLRQLRPRHLGARIVFRSQQWPWALQRLWQTAPWLFRMMAQIRPDYFPLDHRRMFRTSSPNAT